MYSLSPMNMTRSTPASLNLSTALLIAAAPAVADEKPVVQSIGRIDRGLEAQAGHQRLDVSRRRPSALSGQFSRITPIWLSAVR